jgi:hypothetical protein
MDANHAKKYYVELWQDHITCYRTMTVHLSQNKILINKVIKYYRQKGGYAREQSIVNNGQYLPLINISQ